MASDDLLAAAARNMAGWHVSCLNALGVASTVEPDFWSTPGTAPYIFLSGITLGGPGFAESHCTKALAMAESRTGGMGINDTWKEFDLEPLGFERTPEEWFARPPGASNRPAVGVRVERVTKVEELEEFERVHHAGFEAAELHGFGRLGIYGARILEDPAMHVIALRDRTGVMVSVAMAYEAAGVNGIYSVATPPEYRRRGCGAAVTAAAINAAPGLPAVLQPSAMGESVYRRMGFGPVGEIVNWIRRG